MSAESFVSMIESGDWGPRTLAASVVPDTPAGRRGPYTELGVVPQLRRRIRLLDLLPTRTMSGNSIPYTVETGSFDTASETVEGAVKPAGDIGLTDEEARARTIANWVKAPRPVLADVPGLEGVIRDRLTYAVLRRLGTDPGGRRAGRELARDLEHERDRDGAVRRRDAARRSGVDRDHHGARLERRTRAVVIHPVSLQQLLTVKASGSGVYLSIDSPIGTPPTTLWGLPLITSTVMPVGSALIGSFAEGAILWIREAVNVVIGMESDDLIRNRVTLLGEMRAALTVIQPTAFASSTCSKPVRPPAAGVGLRQWTGARTTREERTRDDHGRRDLRAAPHGQRPA